MRKFLFLIGCIFIEIGFHNRVSDAAPLVHRVTLPPAASVNVDTCSFPSVAHVSFRLRQVYANGPTEMDLYAHTDSSLYRWRVGKVPGEGWLRVTRRTAVFRLHCGE